MKTGHIDGYFDIFIWTKVRYRELCSDYLVFLKYILIKKRSRSSFETNNKFEHLNTEWLARVSLFGQAKCAINCLFNFVNA